MMMVAVVLIMLVIVVVVVMIRVVMMINGGRDDGDILSIIARGPDRLSNPIQSNFILLIPSRFNSVQFCCNFHLLPKLDTTMKQALNVFWVDFVFPVLPFILAGEPEVKEVWPGNGPKQIA